MTPFDPDSGPVTAVLSLAYVVAHIPQFVKPYLGDMLGF